MSETTYKSTRQAANEEDVLEIMAQVASITEVIKEATDLETTGRGEISETEIALLRSSAFGEPGTAAQPDSPEAESVPIDPDCSESASPGQLYRWVRNQTVNAPLAGLFGSLLMAAAVFSANFSSSAIEIAFMLVVSVFAGAVSGPIIWSLMTDSD